MGVREAERDAYAALDALATRIPATANAEREYDTVLAVLKAATRMVERFHYLDGSAFTARDELEAALSGVPDADPKGTE